MWIVNAGRPLPGGVTQDDVLEATRLLALLEIEARMCATLAIADRFREARVVKITWPWPWPQGTIDPDAEEDERA